MKRTECQSSIEPDLPMDKSYSVPEVAEFLGVNEQTIRKWIRDGQLKSTMKSKKEGYKISDENLNSFIQSNPKYAKVLASAADAMLKLADSISSLPRYSMVKAFLESDEKPVWQKERVRESATEQCENQLKQELNELEKEQKKLEEITVRIASLTDSIEYDKDFLRYLKSLEIK